MREIRLSGSEGGARLSFVPTPINVEICPEWRQTCHLIARS